ncbi:MAG: hypothetical protein EP329_13515 [Deltaproteobacteria bacterium]|nr:MAG: hypothetical protein EP329_13515 [Deltaproteobacteria bacterium]
MFAGRYDHALDEKGRTMMPKRFRDRLVALGDKSVWITNALGSPNHLDVRPNSSFQEYFERVSRLKNDPMIVDFKRYYFGSAIEVDVDAAGRILVPAQLRNRCGLSDKIAFVGADIGRFELWNPADLDTRFDETAANSAAHQAHLADMGV